VRGSGAVRWPRAVGAIGVLLTSLGGPTNLWDSLDAIRAFASLDVERARYYPEDGVYLLELEPAVTHYEVLVAPPGSAGPDDRQA